MRCTATAQRSRTMQLNRIRAFAVHLAGSSAVVLCAAALVFLVWYPDKLPQATGVTNIFLMLIAVDVIVGPLITLIVFDLKKKELRRDLAVVLLLQLCALTYGLHAVFVARPVYRVFSVDRFELAYANDLGSEKIAKVTDPRFKVLPIWGPETISVRRPDDPRERIEIAMGAAAGGDDLAQLPQFYVPYEGAKDAVIKRLQPLDRLAAFNKDQPEAVQALIQRYKDRGVGYLPMRGKVRDLAVIVATQSGDVLDVVNLSPW